MSLLISSSVAFGFTIEMSLLQVDIKRTNQELSLHALLVLVGIFLLNVLVLHHDIQEFFRNGRVLIFMSIGVINQG